MQYLLIFHILLCVFGDDACLILYGTKSVFLISTIVILSSHYIITSLCCYIVDHFILIVTILRYDYRFALNIIIHKLYVVGTCKPGANS
jgi:hypothetical protein